MGDLVGRIQPCRLQKMRYGVGALALLQESSAQTNLGFDKFGVFNDGALEILPRDLVIFLLPEDFSQLIRRIGIARRDGELFLKGFPRFWH